MENLDFTYPHFINGIKFEKLEVLADKKKFEEEFKKWDSRLNTKGDVYLHEVSIEFNNKIKLINKVYKKRLIGYFLYKRQVEILKCMMFFIYFSVKKFFQDYGKDYLIVENKNDLFVINSFTYVHVASRHYFPDLNHLDFTKSFLSFTPFLDPFQLPISIEKILLLYIENKPICKFNQEYMLFKFNKQPYILHWKYKRCKELKKEFGFEIRSIYPIKSKTDLLKFEFIKIEIIVEEFIFFY
jgi:hypothetical protein